LTIQQLSLTPVQTRRAYATTTAALHGEANTADGAGVDASDFVILTVTDDEGFVGLGEVSDIPPASMHLVPQLQGLLESTLIGADPHDIESLTSGFDFPMDVRPDGTSYDLVPAAVDAALVDLVGKRHGVSASHLHGGRCRERVEVSWVAFIRGLDELEGEIAAKLDEGFTAFKLKVGLDAKLDLARVRLVRELAGEDAHIKLDANSAWSVDEAVEVLRSFEPWQPDGIETPIAYRDVEGKAQVRARTGVPVIEHVHDLTFGIELLRADAIDAVNVSTVGAGGSWRARKVLALAEGAGLPCLLGSTVELGIGTAAQLHLAASSPSVTWPSDLVGPMLYESDVLATAHRWSNGFLDVPDGPGLGVELDEQQMAALATTPATEG